MSGGPRANLLYDFGMITPQGILFKGNYFSCRTLIRKNAFEDAGRRGNQRIRITYLSNIDRYIFLLSNQHMILARKIDHPEELSRDEVEKYFKQVQKLKRKICSLQS